MYGVAHQALTLGTRPINIVVLVHFPTEHMPAEMCSAAQNMARQPWEILIEKSGSSSNKFRREKMSCAAQEQGQGQAQAPRVRRVREDENSVVVRGTRYTKLECVGRGGSSKVYKVRKLALCIQVTFCA